MKETRSNSFSKATITIDEETQEFIIEEVSKDDITVNNLTNILREWVGVEGVNLVIKRDVVAESNME